MLSGRLNNRCRGFPDNASRTLYLGEGILGVAEGERQRTARDLVDSDSLGRKRYFFPVSREFPLERSSRLSASTAKTQNRYHRLL